ncbi:MAG: hypothetical protein KAG28_08500 [Cocleimonas sp.]|nr:hypothetical protein [Cocleimonas sp.]
MLSSLQRSNREWWCSVSALLLSIILNSAYAQPEPVIERSTISAKTNTPSEGNQPATDSPFSLKGKTVSPLLLLQKSLKNTPNNPTLAARLATLYVQRARITSEEKYYRLANEVIKPWAKQAVIPGLAQRKVPSELQLIRATLSQHDHHYADARDDLLSVIRQQPRNVQAWLTLSTLQLIQGDYKKVQVSCSALSRIGANWLSSLCYSQLYSVTGFAARAYKMQQYLLSQLHQQQQALRLWVTGLLAEAAMRQGHHQPAEDYFKAALSIKSNDTYILRTYSDYLLRQQRPKEVIQLLKTPPENDQLLLRFAIATRDLGHHSLEKKLVNRLEQRFAKTFANNNHRHGREEALFLLVFKAQHKASQQRALELAEINWKTQKEPDDALILLRAVDINQSTNKQQIISSWVKQHKLEDQRLALRLSLSGED